MRVAAAALAAGVLLGAAAQAAVDAGAATAPRMEFTPLPAGTYELPPIQQVADAVLLDEHGQRTHLKSLTEGRITLLTFFYTYCVDPLGCPFARVTLAQLRDRILTDPALAARVRFLGISCDPTTDTPAVVAGYAAALTRGRPFDWRFLTAASVPDLLPVLDDLGQDVSVEVGADGTPARALHHMLKVFLIDARGRVREIYTLAYLQPEVMLNDIRTLELEARRGPAVRTAAR